MYVLDKLSLLMCSVVEYLEKVEKLIWAYYQKHWWIRCELDTSKKLSKTIEKLPDTHRCIKRNERTEKNSPQLNRIKHTPKTTWNSD